MTLHLASGEFVVNFDDDDIYSAGYMQTMVGELQTRGLVALTLSSWFNYFESTGVCGYSSADCWEEDEIEDNLYGFGFSYVHRRSFGLSCPYPNVDFAEDAPFMYKLKELCGDAAVGLRPDTEGLCMHIVHRANSTEDPTFSREVPHEELLTLEVAALPFFRDYLEARANFWWPSLWYHMPHFVWKWSLALPRGVCS